MKAGPGGFLGVGLSGFEAQVIQALRELRTEKDAQIVALQAQVKKLESEKTTTAQRLDTLEQRFNALAKPLATSTNSR